jgi:hypothetical protein
MSGDISIVISFREVLGLFGMWTAVVIGVLMWLQKQFKDTRHTLTGSMDQRFSILDEKIDEKTGALDDRLRKVEIKLGSGPT